MFARISSQCRYLLLGPLKVLIFLLFCKLSLRLWFAGWRPIFAISIVSDDVLNQTESTICNFFSGFTVSMDHSLLAGHLRNQSGLCIHLVLYNTDLKHLLIVHSYLK